VPVPCLTIEERSLWDLYLEHFLEANRLGAELHLIRRVVLRAASFVLNWKGHPTTRPVKNARPNRVARGSPVELDDIRATCDTQAEAVKRQVA